MIRSPIVKVLSVVDTRQYEEGSDGKFHPIPGSGSSRECDRCGREHEVHAQVELADRTTAVVGEEGNLRGLDCERAVAAGAEWLGLRKQPGLRHCSAGPRGSCFIQHHAAARVVVLG